MLIRGERLLDYHKPRPFRVTMETLERALAMANAIAAAGKSRGFALRDDEKEDRITIVGHGAEFQIRVVEPLESKLRKSELRKGETEKYKVPTGRLRIVVMVGWREGPIFEDKERVKVEALLNRFFVGLYKMTVKQWCEARVKRRRQEEEELIALRRAEAAKIRAEAERRAAAERRGVIGGGPKMGGGETDSVIRCVAAAEGNRSTRFCCGRHTRGGRRRA
jgi:hypothetical protein